MCGRNLVLFPHTNFLILEIGGGWDREKKLEQMNCFEKACQMKKKIKQKIRSNCLKETCQKNNM
jgi:hypothetical protein